MSSLSSLEVVVLMSLIQSKGSAAIFPLFKKAKVPMADFMKTLSSLRKSGFIKLTDDRVFIEAVGIRQLKLNRTHSQGALCRIVPKNMARSFVIGVNTPYVPAVSRLDKSLFLDLTDGNI